MAASANSPSDALNTPDPLVSTAELSLNSGNKLLSSPADRLCTQRNRGHLTNTSRNSAGDPDQLRRMSASTTACPKASAESPRKIAASDRSLSSIAVCDTSGLPSTRIVLFFMAQNTAKGHG